jgi:hypothetical protein
MITKIRKESLYYIALTIYMWSATIFTTLNWKPSLQRAFIIFGQYGKRVSITILLIYLVWEFSRKFVLWDVVGLFAMIAAFISYRTVYDDTFFMATVFVVCGMRISKRKALKCYYKNLFFCMIAILILLFLGLTQNEIYNFSYGTGYSLGTGHSNILALLILNLTLLWVYLNSEKNKYTIAAICIVVSALMWKITVSRTSTILLATFGIVYLLFYFMLKTNNKFLLHLLRVLILGIICGAIYFMIGGNTESILNIGDHNFAVRFLQAKNIYDRYGLSLWGNNIKFVSMAEAAITKEAVVILDNGLLRLLLFHGCACFGVFILGLVSLEASASRRKDYLLIVISVIFLITGLMEKSVYTLQMNFTLLLMTGLGTGISQDETDKLYD